MLLEASRTVIESSLRSGPSPARSQMNALCHARASDISKLDHEHQRIIQAGMLMSQIRAGRMDQALELAADITASLYDPQDLALTPETAIVLEAALAEAHIAAGYPAQAFQFVNHMRASMNPRIDPRLHGRVLALGAAAYALEGDHDIAEQLLDQHRRLAEAQHWGARGIEYMEAVAEALISFTRMDIDRFRALQPRLKQLAKAETSATSLSRIVDAICLFYAGDTEHALRICRDLKRGKEHPPNPILIRDFALMLEAIVLIARGEPQQALAVIGSTPSSSNHCICMGYLHGSAYLQLKDYRRVLRSTDTCIHERRVHNQLSLPAVLLRRAIAHLRLGNHKQALDDAAEAIIIVERTDPAAGLFMLPADDISALGALLLRRMPQLLPKLLYVRSRLSAVPPTAPPKILLPTLSQRERVVAHHLRSDMSYTKIAQLLHVAPTTVKSQALAVYRKLGVKTRKEAVDLLENGGFYTSEDPAPDA